jgi:hypothetical protein
MDAARPLGAGFGLCALFCLVMGGIFAITHTPPTIHVPPVAPPQEKVVYTPHSMEHPEWKQVVNQLAACTPATLFSKSLRQYMKVCIDFKTKKVAFQLFYRTGTGATIITQFFPKLGQPLQCAQEYVNATIREGAYQLVSGVLPYGIHAIR